MTFFESSSMVALISCPFKIWIMTGPLAMMWYWFQPLTFTTPRSSVGSPDGGHGFVFRSVGDAGQLPSRREYNVAWLAPTLLVQVAGISIREIHIGLVPL